MQEKKLISLSKSQAKSLLAIESEAIKFRSSLRDKWPKEFKEYEELTPAERKRFNEVLVFEMEGAQKLRAKLQQFLEAAKL